MIADGDSVLLIDELGNRYSAKASQGKLQTDFGLLNLSAVSGTYPGTGLKSDLGKDFVVIAPPARKICFFGSLFCDK